MRLLNICIFAFFLVWLINFAYVNHQEQKGFAAAFGFEDKEVQQLYVGKQHLCHTDLSDNTNLSRYFIQSKEPTSWLALSGMPGYQKITYDLPKYTKVKNGLLVLDLESSLQEDAVGRLKISINGERSAELVLEEGVENHSVQIELEARHLNKEHVQVALQTTGNMPVATCSDEWSGGAVVKVQPTSRLEIETVHPIVEMADKIRVMGHPYRLVFSNQDNTDMSSKNELIQLALQQKRNGYDLTFYDDVLECPTAITLTKGQMKSESVKTLNKASKPERGEWPIRLGQKDYYKKVRYFDYENVWKIPYEVGRTPNGELPEQLEFNLVVDGVEQKAGWLLTVEINDVAIHSERISDNAFMVDRVLDIPVQYQGERNELEIKLISSQERNAAQCVGDNKMNVAQLGATTKLIGGIAWQNTASHGMLETLPDNLVLEVDPDIGAEEANSVVNMLHEGFGKRVNWLLDEQAIASTDYAKVYISKGLTGFGTELADREILDDLMLVTRNEDVNADLNISVKRFTDSNKISALNQLGADEVVALIAIPENNGDRNIALGS